MVNMKGTLLNSASNNTFSHIYVCVCVCFELHLLTSQHTVKPFTD